MHIDELIAAADREANHRRTIYKRLRVHHFVSDDYADSRIAEMVLISSALQRLKIQGVERIESDCQRSAQDGAQAIAQDADRSKAQGRNATNRQKRVRGAA